MNWAQAKKEIMTMPSTVKYMADLKRGFRIVNRRGRNKVELLSWKKN